MRVFQDALHRGVVERDAALRIDGNAQLFEKRETRRGGLILERSGREPDETIGEPEYPQLGASLLKLLDVDAHRVTGRRSQVGQVEQLQVGARHL